MNSTMPRSLLVVGPPGHLGASDIAAKLEAICSGQVPRRYRVLFDADSAFHDADAERGITLFDSIWRTADAGLAGALLPTFASHRFASELAPVSPVPIASIMAALVEHVTAVFPDVRRIGVLASAPVKALGLFERAFEGCGIEVIYPRARALDDLTLLIEELGVASSSTYTISLGDRQRAQRAHDDVVAQAPEVILVGSTVLSGVLQELKQSALAAGLPLIDSNQVYAAFAASQVFAPVPRPFKVGVVGGIGPAATVSFLDKLVRATPAARDQDHLKVVVEQNPQIPDRTAYLVGAGADPTLALYATCRKLQDADADIIAIPCNTAHAFVSHIQPMLGIPIVHMLRETVDFIAKAYGDARRIGLLATSGTIAARVYHDEIERTMRQTLTPDAATQDEVMDAIYGPRGVKSGFRDPQGRARVEAAIRALAGRGAEVIILGCTELPLLVEQNLGYRVDGRTIPIIDPAQVLAERCIAYGRAVSSCRPGSERGHQRPVELGLDEALHFG